MSKNPLRGKLTRQVNRDLHTEEWYTKVTKSGKGKVCALCEQWKPVGGFHKQGHKKDGFSARCNECRKREWQDQGRRTKYGLSEESFLTLKALQESRCAICGTHEEKRPLVVDHCHDSERVRGLLCHQCNVALGYFQDDPRRLISGVAYLAKAAGFEPRDASIHEFLKLETGKASDG